MASRLVSYYALFECMAASEPTTHPFPLNTYFGTLTAGLGSFPFDHGTYLPQSDSRSTHYGIRSLMIFGKLRRPLGCSVLYLHLVTEQGQP